jgi:hypothetical protein
VILGVNGISNVELVDTASEVDVRGNVLTGVVLAGDAEIPAVEFVRIGSELVGKGTSVASDVERLVEEDGSSETGIPVEIGVAEDSSDTGIPVEIRVAEVSSDTGIPVEALVPDGASVTSVPEDKVADGGKTPDVVPASVVGTGSVVGIAEERDDIMLDTTLSLGIGAVPVGIPDWISDTSDDTRLSTSEVIADAKLDSSETSDDGAMGRGVIPGGVLLGAVGPAVGSVIPTPELGTTPETVSEGAKMDDNWDIVEDRIGISAVSDLLSEVGIGAESVSVGVLESEVPNAVVIPTTMPEVGKEDGTSDVGTSPFVGRTTVLGTPPEEPVGTGLAGSDSKTFVGAATVPVESEDGTFVESEGCTTLDSRALVDPGMMKGPKMVVSPVETESEGLALETRLVLGKTADPGMAPVEPADDASVGRTISLGAAPVELIGEVSA